MLPPAEQHLLQQEIQKLLCKGAITEVAAKEAEQGFHSSLFLVPTKDGGMRPVINLKSLNEFVVPQHFKMEGLHTLKDILKQNNWLTKVDLKDAFFMVPMHDSCRPALRFLVLTISSSSHVCHSAYPVLHGSLPRPKASPNLAQRAWSEASGIHRRHPRPSGDGDGEGPHQQANIPTREPGVHNSPREVYHNPDPGDRVPWYGCRLVLNGATAPGAESKETEARIFKDQGSDSPAHCSGGVTPTGEIQLGCPGNTSGSSVLQEPIEGPSKCLGSKRTQLRCSLPAVTGSQGRAGLVDEPFHSLEWEEPGTRQPELQIESDASLIGWGASCQGTQTGGPWSQAEKRMHINCLELLAATLAVKTFLKDQVDKRVLLLLDNQNLHKQLGWDSVPPGNQVSQGLMDVVSGDRHPPYSTTPTGGREYQGRQGVESDERSLRLDAEPRDFSSDMDSLSPTGSRPICHLSIIPAPSLLQLASRPIGRSDRCFPPGLESSEGLRQSPLEPDREGIGESRATEGRANPSGANMALSALVPQATQPSRGTPPEDRSSG